MQFFTTGGSTVCVCVCRKGGHNSRNTCTDRCRSLQHSYNKYHSLLIVIECCHWSVWSAVFSLIVSVSVSRISLWSVPPPEEAVRCKLSRTHTQIHSQTLVTRAQTKLTNFTYKRSVFVVVNRTCWLCYTLNRHESLRRFPWSLRRV